MSKPVPQTTQARKQAAVKGPSAQARYATRRSRKRLGIFAEAHVIADDHRVNRNRRPW